MILLKNKSEQISVETDGKVDVYVSWRDWPQPGEIVPMPDSLLTIVGGGGENIVLAQNTDYPIRQLMSFIASCRDQKGVSVKVFITDGSAKALLAAGTLNPDSSIRYSPTDGFAVRQAA